MATKKSSGARSVTVPIDVSQVDDAKGRVKVVAIAEDGKRTSQTVDVSKGKTASATFKFAESPGSLRIFVGPENVAENEIDRLQTISTTVPARTLALQNAVTVPALKITPVYWHLWLIWCREFTINGRLLCPDGKPVPGATVCAWDVDRFFIWYSKQQIGCAVTDANGAFQIKFRWCCGWWPWWWWRLRNWQIDFDLARSVFGKLRPEVKIKPIPLPEPAPDVAFLEALLPQTARGLEPSIGRQPAVTVINQAEATAPAFARIEALRPALVEVLPKLDLRIWPWFPIYPWRDCRPDIVFTATQECGGQNVVVLDEPFSQTDFDISTTHNVTLHTNEKACCRPDGGSQQCAFDEPCLLITHACSYERTEIGQDPADAAHPGGYVYPGESATRNYGADRPFAENITISGTTDCMDGVDYYSVEYAQWNGAAWNAWAPMPPASLGGFVRSYLEFAPIQWHHPTFTATLRDGQHVYESRPHFEAAHPSYLCMGGCNTLFVWLTSSSAWADGTYKVRILGWKDAGGGNLDPVPLNVCGESQPSELVLTIDNRPPLPDPFHPISTSDHPCGTGTVHACTSEPDTDIVAVRLIHADGSTDPILPCKYYDRRPGDRMEIDFLVEDRSEHLAYFTLHATYGENLVSNLLTGGTTLSTIGADFEGPTYRDAVTQGATPPKWKGGLMRLTLDAAQLALHFPEPCCYQFELRAWKRPIVSCNGDFVYGNLSEYSFFLGDKPLCDSPECNEKK